MNENLEDIGYALLFIYTLGGGFFGLATAAVLSSLGKMNIILAIAIAASANFAGSTFLFYFARKSKADAMSLLKKHRRKLAFVHIMMKKRGSYVIFIQKFLYGIKTLVPLAAGITKYNQLKFIPLNFAASLLWAVVIGTVAFLSGNFILQVIDTIEQYPWIAPILLFSVGGSVYFYINKVTKK